MAETPPTPSQPKRRQSDQLGDSLKDQAKSEIDAEIRKRRRERRIAVVFSVAFILSTFFQAFITGRRQAYGFVQSLLYFGLVHLNVILIMFLVFLVSRNLIKAYLMRRTGKLGSTLRWKMVTSLLGFSMLPSLLLFVGSSYVIRQGFDRWFSGQVSSALQDAQAITQVHYEGIESNLNFFADRSAEIYKRPGETGDQYVKGLLKEFPLQAAEIYTSITLPPQRSIRDGVADWAVPRAAVESLQRAMEGEEFSLIRQFGDGDLVQHFKSLKKPGGAGRDVLVLSHTVPLGLKTRIADLRSAFSGYSNALQFKDSLKTNYTLILLTLFVLVLFVVSWFGLYIAKSVTDPVQELMKATEAFREGNWKYRIPGDMDDDKRVAGFGADLQVLKSAFNTMAGEVGMRGRKLEEANAQLISLVRDLEDRERYLEILLSSIRRGVVVLDPQGRIQRVNFEALEFAAHTVDGKWTAPLAIGKPWLQIFSNFVLPDEMGVFLEESRHARGNPVDRIFEMKTGPQFEASLHSIRATGISLVDETRQALGWLIIFEDVSDAARLERLAAWQEVARRVAHEIKNPLTPIQISADRLVRRFADKFENDPENGAVFWECVGQIQKQVRVIRDLVREFSQFAKLPEPNFTAVNLEELLAKVVADYRFTHPTVNWEYAVNARERSLLVRGDPEYLRRLIVNLFDNALHSMEEAKITAPRIAVAFEDPVNSPAFIAVVFQDNGPGIPAGLKDKIFDPYVTSKASGLGLGLPIVRRIAIEHAGRIRCEDSPVGARFVLELPLLNARDNLDNTVDGSDGETNADELTEGKNGKNRTHRR